MGGIGGYARYAVYWAPERGSWLEAFGASWLGWDAEAGEQRMQPSLDLPLSLAEITATPARYGFHATLKPPFRLADGQGAGALDRAVATFAAREAPVEAPGLAPAALDGFAALVPSGPAPALEALALACVTGLDAHRAPLTQAERARRSPERLTERQRALLGAHGYPFVGPEFRFHVTLSGRLDPEALAAVLEAVSPVVAPYLDPVLRVDEICLFGDPGEGRPFRLLRRYPLTG